MLHNLNILPGLEYFLLYLLSSPDKAYFGRISRDFNEEYPKLRIFSHPNVLPVLGCCNSPPNLVVISQYMPVGSLHNVLHQGTG